MRIQFNNRDVMPILNEPKLFNSLLDKLVSRVKHVHFDRILGIESRGFLIGPPLALKLQLPFGPIRKKGKLPGQLYSVQYELEYGHDVLEVQKDGLPKGSKCLIIDDLIATGGSMEASKRLVEMSGSQVAACLVVIELRALKGVEKLGGTPFFSLFSYG
jgi:adenine phosphoribosyltransferase